MLLAQKLGLQGFEEVKQEGPLETRARHHIYAVTTLGLVVESSRLQYNLTDLGDRLATLAISYDIKPVQAKADEADPSLPEEIKQLFREILCASQYVRYWWLKYFMPREDFSIPELQNEGKDVLIEFLPSHVRGAVEIDREQDIEDTGFRLHSFYLWPSLKLDEAQKREIYDGLRRWSLRLDLVGEIRWWRQFSDTEEEFRQKLETSKSRADRIYVVRKRWPSTAPVGDFENILLKIRGQLGNPARIRIPELTMLLTSQEGFSLRQIHELLHRLYQERPNKYFFESASSLLLARAGERVLSEKYVQLDGTWRTGIIFQEQTIKR